MLRVSEAAMRPGPQVQLDDRRPRGALPAAGLLPRIVCAAGLKTGGTAIKYPSPLNVLKDTHDRSDEYQHLLTDSPTATDHFGVALAIPFYLISLTWVPAVLGGISHGQ